MIESIRQRCRSIQLTDQPGIDAVRARQGHTLSAHAFTSLFLWQKALKLSVCLEEDGFFVRFALRGENAWFYPCGSQEWLVLRVGMDFKIRCQGCGHEVMLPRSKVEKNIRKVMREGQYIDLP